MRRVLLVLSILVFMGYGGELKFCSDIIKQNHDRKSLVQEKTMCKVKLSEIYPTQSIVGEVAVDCKVKKLEKTLKKDYKGDEEEFKKDYLCKKKTFLPIVVGFKSRMYITDHHHLSSAILKSKEIKTKELNAFILHDYSHDESWDKINESKFWFLMNEEKLVYLKDNGKKIGYEDLPACLSRLKNDSFRTLSRWVRESGCYTKEKAKDRNDNVCDKGEFPLNASQAKSSYYAEFKYADILRDEFSSKVNNSNKKDEVKSLVKIYPKSIDYLKNDYECSDCKEIKGVDKDNYCKKFD